MVAVLSASSVLVLVALVVVCSALSQTPELKGTPLDLGESWAETNVASNQPTVGLALSGGGFLAMAAYTGIIVGYDQLTTQTREGSTVGSILRDSLETISSVSGGSWFSAQLIYSNSFNQLLDKMTANTSGVSDMYNTHWNERVFQGFGGQPFSGSSTGRSPFEQWIQVLKFLKNQGMSWRQFVGSMLKSAADIDSSVSLGSQTQEWAQGKKWLIDHSMLTQKTVLWSSDLCADKVYSTYVQPSGLPTFTPAAFSVILGSTAGSAAPYPYCLKCDDSSMQIKIEARNHVLWWVDTKHANSPSGDLNSAFKSSMSSLGVVDVVASSSAFLGGFNADGWNPGGGLSDAVDILQTLGATCLTTDLGVPISNNAGEAAFSQAEQILGQLTSKDDDPQNLVNSLASNSVRMVADGALTDNTGIAMLVANKHKVITAFVPYTSSSSDEKPFSDLLQLFGECSSTITPVGELLPVFEGACETVESMVDSDTFISLAVPDSAKHLVSIRIGSMKLTTIDYPPLNIQAGMEVQLNVLLLASTLNMGSADMNVYGGLVEEIVNTFRLNEDKTQQVLSILKL